MSPSLNGSPRSSVTFSNAKPPASPLFRSSIDGSLHFRDSSESTGWEIVASQTSMLPSPSMSWQSIPKPFEPTYFRRLHRLLVTPLARRREVGVAGRERVETALRRDVGEHAGAVVLPERTPAEPDADAVVRDEDVEIAVVVVVACDHAVRRLRWPLLQVLRCVGERPVPVAEVELVERPLRGAAGADVQVEPRVAVEVGEDAVRRERCLLEARALLLREVALAVVQVERGRLAIERDVEPGEAVLIAVVVDVREDEEGRLHPAEAGLVGEVAERLVAVVEEDEVLERDPLLRVGEEAVSHDVVAAVTVDVREREPAVVVDRDGDRGVRDEVVLLDPGRRRDVDEEVLAERRERPLVAREHRPGGAAVGAPAPGLGVPASDEHAATERTESPRRHARIFRGVISSLE